MLFDGSLRLLFASPGELSASALAQASAASMPCCHSTQRCTGFQACQAAAVWGSALVLQFASRAGNRDYLNSSMQAGAAALILIAFDSHEMTGDATGCHGPRLQIYVAPGPLKPKLRSSAPQQGSPHRLSLFSRRSPQPVMADRRPRASRRQARSTGAYQQEPWHQTVLGCTRLITLWAAF